ncbi:hypothetical protein [Tenuibacillus multivorans]|nr:hypothetical protein [Tenuibacillus multivorans]GEL78220.1 hypothetical protein TMU01_24550 [Tenuibacillus multivorans]
MYESIFRDIIDIIHHDYLGCKDKEGWDHPEEFEDSLHEGITKSMEIST